MRTYWIEKFCVTHNQSRKCTVCSCELSVVPWILADSIICCHLTNTERFKDWFIHNHKSLNECRIPYGTQLYVPNSCRFLHTILSVFPSLCTPFLYISCTSIVRCFVIRVILFLLALFSSHIFISRAFLFLIFVLLGCFSPYISLYAAFCVSVCLF